MGQFNVLSDVGRVLQSVIEGNVPGTTEVRIAPPVEEQSGAAPAVRVTLLWTTPQPTHRNDPSERNADGTIALAPSTLSVFYLVTTYGTTPEGNALEAHDLLGSIIAAFHVTPRLPLPVDGLGEGWLGVTQMTMEPDLVEKIYTPLQLRLRPWVMFEVAPVQLVRTDEGMPVPVVRPGGLALAPIEVVTPPRIERITPSSVGFGGRIRIDAAYTGNPARVTIGAERIEPPEIAALEPGGPVRANLPPAVTAQAYDLTLAAANNISSQPAGLTVLDINLPSIFAPGVAEHSAAGDLVLDGASLGANGDPLAAFFWPDSGISAPGEVVELAGAVEGGGTALRITAAELAGLRPTLYRISVRMAAHLYTSYVLLEITP